MAWMRAALGPFGPGFFGHGLDENSRRYLRRTHQRLMKCEERRGAYANGDLSDASWTEEERPESAEQPVAQCQVRRLASTAQDDQLLLEQEILRDHGSYATGATQLRGHDGEVKQGEQELLHARDSVGQSSGAPQRCLNPGFSERIGNSRRTRCKPAAFKMIT